MKRVISVLLLVLLVLSLTACGKEKTAAEDIKSGDYDWEAARVAYATKLEEVIGVVFGGTPEEYAAARLAWIPSIVTEAQSDMFPNANPPQGCTVSVMPVGFSGPAFNSEGATYFAYNVRVMNLETLDAVQYDVSVRLDRGANGFIVAEFTKEVQK